MKVSLLRVVVCTFAMMFWTVAVIGFAVHLAQGSDSVWNWMFSSLAWGVLAWVSFKRAFGEWPYEVVLRSLRK